MLEERGRAMKVFLRFLTSNFQDSPLSLFSVNLKRNHVLMIIFQSITAHNTPYEFFKKRYTEYLKTGLTIEDLDKIASSKSEYESAQEMNKYRKDLFKDILDY